MIVTEENINVTDVKDAPFWMVDKKIFFRRDNRKMCFDLAHITNIRMCKTRNLLINNLILFLIGLTYYSTFLYFKMDLLIHLCVAAFMLILMWSSLSIQFYSQKLLINFGFSEFCEIKLRQKDLLLAKQVVSQFSNIKTDVDKNYNYGVIISEQMMA